MEKDSKLKEDEMLHVFSGVEHIPKEYISNINSSMLMSPENLKQVLENHNELIVELQKFEKQAINYKKEVDSLKTTLEKELQKEQPNIKEITDQIVKQELEE